MKREFKTLGFFIIFISSAFSSANAADMEMSSMTTARSWSGFHFGFDLGFQTNTANQTLTVNDPQQSLSGQGANANQAVLLRRVVKSAQNPSTGGVHLDYLFQNSNLVYGASVELMAASCKFGSTRGSTLNDPTKAPFPDYFSTVSGQNCFSYLSTIKAKVGRALGNTLAYVDGGPAIGRSRSRVNATITNVGNPPDDMWAGSRDKTMVGYSVGAGIQYAIEQNATIGLRYSHYDFGKMSYFAKPDAFTAGDLPGVYQTMRARIRGNLIQFSLDYQY